MTPYVFQSDSSRKASDILTSSRLTLRFSGKDIIPSKLLCQFLGLEAGCYVTIMLDEDEPMHVYIRRALDNPKYQTAKVCYHGKAKDRLKFCSKAVVEHMLAVTQSEKHVTLFVKPKPTEVSGMKYYRIITETPYAK